jgi:UDP-N-acetylmuramoyl-tripeptide--D-alanyl-D-alanine ligase
VLVDDCYNAQPGSVKAAIDLLAEVEGRRTLLLGAMKELGPDSESLHIEVARYAKASGIEQMWGVGAELKSAVKAFGEGGHYFSDREASIDFLAGVFSQGDTVLVKGSRSVGMETVLAALATDKSAAGG